MIIDKLKKRNNTVKTEINKGDIPVGKWVKCDKCLEIIYKDTLHNNYSVCPSCGNHFRLSSRRRISQITDEGSFKAFEELNIKTVNPLSLEGYMEKLENLKEKTGIDEAVLCGIRKNKFRRSSYLCYGW